MNESKSAIITGASSGMGLEYSRQLAAKGFNLLMISNRAEELSEAAETLRKEYGIKIESCCLDLASQGAAAKVLEWTDSPAPGLPRLESVVPRPLHLQPGNYEPAAASAHRNTAHTPYLASRPEMDIQKTI